MESILPTYPREPVARPGALRWRVNVIADYGFQQSQCPAGRPLAVGRVRLYRQPDSEITDSPDFTVTRLAMAGLFLAHAASARFAGLARG